MSIEAKYSPSEKEDKWYKLWKDQGFFKAKVNPDKEPYTIIIPPPNVTGVLHMGHMLNNTIQDVLIRKARMEGKEACWVPGTDHASIATEAKVVQMLRGKGIKKSDLSRDEFLSYAWEWKEKYGGIILEQLKKLGASCDWDRTVFTMDDDYYRAVIRVFVDLYKKKYIYRGLRMINWDCEAQTALSNEEVIYKEEGETVSLYHVKYAIEGSDESITIATVRPETILGDAAIAVNPKDKRYTHLVGKKALVPFINRPIPIIADSYVELDFGTGCLKVTPAHDINDYEIGVRHELEVIDTINLDGTINEKCEVPKYVGKDRFKVRKEIIKDLAAENLLIKEEQMVTRIGRSERTNSVIEPKLSLQWFIKMKEISKKAHQVVMNDEVKLYPSKFKSTYNHWMENVRDWCISRQLWWGQRIPAYYYGTEEDDYVVAEDIETALALAKEKSGNQNLKLDDLKQDEDVLDTWASSWLFPITSFKGFEDGYFDHASGSIKKEANKELDYFYPTKVLVTAPEILFFWVARMIIAGYEYTGKKPFEDVYLTGIVRDKQRRKMSKSLGNSPDPLELIKSYGADGVRTGMLFSSPAGNDLLFDEKLVEQGRNFANKIWNAYRLIKGWEIVDKPINEVNNQAVKWFEVRLHQALEEIEIHFTNYRISDALMSTYKLIWNDFCSWYLEWIKPPYGSPIDRETYDHTINLFRTLMRILHPFMPFISEEIWDGIKSEEDNYLIISGWPENQQKGYQKDPLDEAKLLFDLTGQIRNIRSEKGLSPKEELALHIKTNNKDRYKKIELSIKKMANLSTMHFVEEKPENCISFVYQSDELFLPVIALVDVESERIKLEEELKYVKGFLISVEKKLSNKKFVEGAPEKVVEIEKKKKEDAEAKIKALEASLSTLN